jgi:hypothetical protein
MIIFRLIKKLVRKTGITLFWISEVTGLPRIPENSDMKKGGGNG